MALSETLPTESLSHPRLTLEPEGFERDGRQARLLEQHGAQTGLPTQAGYRRGGALQQERPPIYRAAIRPRGTKLLHAVMPGPHNRRLSARIEQKGTTVVRPRVCTYSRLAPSP
jgi:hypothetical protein